jgi:hypothetical protein
LEIALLLTIVTCVACIAAGLLVSALRPLAVAAGAVGLFVVCSLVWWALLYVGIVPEPPHGLLGSVLFFVPPLLPSVALVFASMRRGGAA